MGIHIEDRHIRNAKAWLKLVTVAVCSVFVCAQVWAASALAYDSITGVLGYGIGTDKATAKAAALADCTNNGATTPVFWFWHQKAGWGATVYSDDGGGAWTIGGTLGYKKKKRAKKIAKSECRDSGGTNCQVVAVFKDTIGKKSAGGGGKSLHLSSN
jgi:hypothetical protein